MGAGWRPIGHLGRLPSDGDLRRLVVYLAAACGLPPGVSWETELRELAAIGKAATAREKRLLKSMGRLR